MKTALACIIAIALGIGAGVTAGLLTYSNPGPDFVWMNKPLIYEVTDPDAVTSAGVQSIDVVDGPEFDFGVMDRGETRTHTFFIKNNTSAPMYPKVTGTTCKCTVGDLEDDHIGPGEEGKVKLEWVAKSLDTEFRQTATIETRNEVRPDVALSVFGRVIQMVDARPRNLAFSDISVRDERSAEFVVYAFKDDRLVVIEDEWVKPELGEFFEFKWRTAPDDVVEEMEDASSAIIGTVTIKPGMPLGRITQGLKLKTNSSKAGAIEIPVFANIVGDITISGERYSKQTEAVMLGPVNSREGAETKVSMMVKGKHAPDFEVSDIVVDPADEKILSVSIDEVKSFRDGMIKMFPLRIAVPTGATSANYSGGSEHPTATIKLKTNHPDAEELTISVIFSVVE